MTNKWDLRYLKMAELVSTWSKDPSTQTGAVIVRANGTVAGVGFNGFPKGMSDDPALYANREEKYSRIVHCEVNALLFSGGLIEGATLYTWPFISCDRCLVQMLQAGIKRFVAPAASLDGLSRWGSAFDKVKKYVAEAGVELLEVSREELGLEP